MSASSGQQEFRALLRGELLRRMDANPRYSLRSFARFLRIQPGFLSNILRGKRSITVATVGRLGPRLGLGPDELRRFQREIAGRYRPSRPGTPGYARLARDHFQILSDWHHFAILELVHVRGFVPSPAWAARALGLRVTQAQAAIERLQRAGMLKVEVGGGWRVEGELNTTTLGTDLTRDALRAFQKQILGLAIRALEETPPELRDQTGMTMAIDSTLLPEAKRRITRFRRSFCAFLENGPQRDRVYQLSISLFPLQSV